MPDTRKRPSHRLLTALLAVALLFATLLAGCSTVSTAVVLDPALDALVHQAVMDHNADTHASKTAGTFACEDHVVIGTKARGDTVTVYAWVLYQCYEQVDGELRDTSGSHVPVAITARTHDGTLELVEYWEPRDGTYYAKDIKAKVPAKLYRAALDSQRYIDEQQQRCQAAAQAHFGTTV